MSRRLIGIGLGIGLLLAAVSTLWLRSGSPGRDGWVHGEGAPRSAAPAGRDAPAQAGGPGRVASPGGVLREGADPGPADDASRLASVPRDRTVAERDTARAPERVERAERNRRDRDVVRTPDATRRSPIVEDPAPDAPDTPDAVDPAELAQLESEAADLAESQQLLSESELQQRVDRELRRSQMSPEEARRKVLADAAIVEQMLVDRYGPDVSAAQHREAIDFFYTLLHTEGAGFRTQKLGELAGS